MVCDPSKNNINISVGPGPSLPGLDLPFSIPKLPFPDLRIPDGIPEDIIDLIEKIFAQFPQGIKFIPNADALTKSVWDALASLFNQLAPFLAMYKFIQALLNIILCIIDILCSLYNPWATSRAIKRLFKKCLPDFLSLFPWLALLMMILALILLLIALIEYIIQMIIDYINQIIANIKILTRAITVHDEEATIAAINKISYLLCLIEQLFSILIALSALFAIIKPLMALTGRSVCSSGSGSCCTEDFCPIFIANGGIEGPKSSTGHLIYHTEIAPNYPNDEAFNFLKDLHLPPQRTERWQFIDDNPIDFKFLDIITPSPEFGFTYWPEGESYESDSNIIKVPYLLDMNIIINPREFGNSNDVSGIRKFNIRNILVKTKPDTYPLQWDNTRNKNVISGSIIIGGGTVWEYDESSTDGYSQYFINNEPATLETFITKESNLLYIPANDDTQHFINIEYNFRYNYEVLADKKLITMMCKPDLAIESAVFNAEFGDLRSVLDKVGDLPDIGSLSDNRTDGSGALGCLARSLTEFRVNINEETALNFQAKAEDCLNNLKNEAIDFYCKGSAEAVDRYSSDFEIYPDIQFIDGNIDVTIRLRDKSGTQIGVGVSQDIGLCLAKNLKAKATLGKITSFTYDGYSDFKATLSSSEAGTGELTAYINNEPFCEVINRDNDDAESEIINRVINYEFIDSTSLTYRRDQGDKTKIDFDQSDIAGDGS